MLNRFREKTVGRKNVPLCDYTTFRIGGPARYFFEPRTLRELQSAFGVARECQLPVYVLGAGSNLLIADEGVDGAVICMRRFERTYVRRFGNLVRVSAGVPLQRLLNHAADWGLCGLEQLAGVPGTIGGAVRMNAGTPATCVGDHVSFLEILRPHGGIERVYTSDVQWGYRSTDLGEGIVAFAEMELRTASAEMVKEKMREALERKRAAQPLSVPSAGCFFKNPNIAPAGKLVDQAGLKGLEQGGAAVSKKHANFIVNRGGATARDVMSLVGVIRKAVRELSGVELESEVCLWP